MRRRILPKRRKSAGFYQFFVLSIIAMTITLCAISPAYGGPSQSDVIGTGRKTAQAVRVEHAPRLDGTLNDPLWHAAEPVRDFRQREPHEGQTPTEVTEVRILSFTRGTKSISESSVVILPQRPSSLPSYGGIYRRTWMTISRF